jgi:flavin-dependent dehydrogenase
MIDDVIVVGAGPAGSVAATLLARAGARVRLLDRARFPRDKLCGDTINPGTLAMLRRLRLASAVERRAALRLDGMLVTGGSGIAIEGRYPDGLYGLALGRRDLDWALVETAIEAGVRFEPGVAVRDVLVAEEPQGRRVGGVTIDGGHSGAPSALRAPVTIAADGRRSILAFRLGLARHPSSPRRWAIGAYFEANGWRPSFGEMHVRPGRYIGVAQLPAGLTNVCLVRAASREARDFGSPEALLRRELEADPLLRARFAGARIARPPVVLGPLAVEPAAGGLDGLLLAGDAAGFIDPMTGDGLRFAIGGGELAAAAALEALTGGWAGVRQRHGERRRRSFGGKWRFNRALRSLVASPLALRSATMAARIAPALVAAIVERAGDCDLASAGDP